MGKHFALAAFVAAAIGALLSDAVAQNYPSRPVTLTVGAPPGAVADMVAKGFARAATKELKQPVLVENRASFQGAEAAEMVQASQPDGYRLLVFSGAQHFSLPAIRSTDYDPIAGFTPITTLFTQVNLLVVPSNSPVNTLAELMAQGKTKPQGLMIGSTGLGSTSHLTAASLAAAANVPLRARHFPAVRDMMTDLLRSQIDFTLVPYAVAKAGLPRLKVLAVDTPERWTVLPDAPTLKEAGFDRAPAPSWFGLAARAGTPAQIIVRLNAAFAKAAANPELQSVLVQNGVLVVSSSPQDLQTLMQRENQATVALVQQLKLKQ